MLTKTNIIRVILFNSIAVYLTLLSPAVMAGSDAILTLGTWNVEYFFDDDEDPYTNDEKFQAKPKKAMAALAKTIRSINVDFLALQEIENEGVLANFNRQYLGDMGYHHQWVNERAGKTAINLAFLSRVPVDEVTVYRFDEFTLPGANRTWPFARDLVRVTLKPGDDMTLHVFMLHFKAKSGSTPDDPMSANWRLAEATQVHARVAAQLKKDPSAWIAVIGDVNDLPESPPCLALTQPGDNINLVDVHAGIPRAKRNTLLRQSSYQAIEPNHPVDYILVSTGLAERLVPESTSRPVPMDINASDHIPLLATFDLTP
jgi:endonuclease/exonuclease/phosphatase family metal-dependent hydrolase